MILSTRHFGDIEIDTEKTILFNEGIPGFEKAKRFTLIDNEDTESPFKWLQCCDSPELAFAVINPFMVIKDYEFELRDEIVKKLEMKDEKDIEVYSIVVVPEDVMKMTMNLKAPLIINTQKHKGMQVVLDTDKYSVRHYILNEIREQEEAEYAGAYTEVGANNHSK